MANGNLADLLSGIDGLDLVDCEDHGLGPPRGNQITTPRGSTSSR